MLDLNILRGGRAKEVSGESVVFGGLGGPSIPRGLGMNGGTRGVGAVAAINGT